MNGKEATILAKLLDKAIMSDNDEVKSMLNELLMVVALTDRSPNDDGPFARHEKQIAVLKSEMSDMHDRLRRLTNEISDNKRGYGSGYRNRMFRDDYTEPHWTTPPSPYDPPSPQNWKIDSEKLSDATSRINKDIFKVLRGYKADDK